MDIIIRTTSKKHGPPTYPGAKLQSQQSPEHAHIHAGTGGVHRIHAHHRQCTQFTVHSIYNAHYPQCTPSTMHNANHPLAGCTVHTMTAHFIFWIGRYKYHIFYCTLQSVQNKYCECRPKRICSGQSHTYNSLSTLSLMIFIIIIGLFLHQWPDIY